MKLYNQIKLNECNLRLSNDVVGINLNVDNKSSCTVDDIIFDRILAINKIDYKNINQQYQRMFNMLKLDSTQYIDLISLLGKARISEKVSEFQDICNKSLTDYYFSVLKSRYELTDIIKDASYDHISSITGRMVIKEGVNYLTMKKDHRNKIDKKTDNCLVEIDVKSCEPALLHHVIYDEMPDDIYEVFSEPGISRAKTKIAVISSLYGSSPARVKKISGLSTKTIKKIHDHFQLQSRIIDLEKEYSKKGYFLNLYGRPIYEISSPVNYWLQSTAADFCCLAFKAMIEDNNLKLKAVIHDAIIVEVDDKQHSAIKDIHQITDTLSGISLRVDNTLIA